MNADSAYYKAEFINQLEKLKKDLSKDFDVHSFTYGDGVRIEEDLDFKDQLSDLSAFFKEVNTRYYNSNIGAVIVASDGIINSGSDPFYFARNSKYPVYSINLGDTITRKDIRLQKVNYNKTVIKGNRFPVEINIQAVDLVGEKSTITVSEENSILFSQEFEINSSNQILTIPAYLEANEVGLKRYKVSIDDFESEINKSNNNLEIYIEVEESMLKVAIVSDSPHPDVAALQRSLQNSNFFEVQLFKAKEFNLGKSDSYSLIIMNQLPSWSNAYTSQLNNIIQSGIPLLFIIGSESNIQLVNSLDIGLSMTNFKKSYNESLPALNNSFSLFLLSESQKKLFEVFPPLISPFANYYFANSAQVLAYQQIGKTTTNMPLILFNESMGIRRGVISGEGIWKWRMYDYIKNNTHDNFDDLVRKMIQYLTIQTDRNKFRVEWKNFYAENENIEFGAMLFNDSYEPVTEPDVTMEIINEENKKFDYQFSSSDQRYSLKLGYFQPGVYTFKAKAVFAGNSYSKSGNFIVTDIKLEDVNLVANHKLLNRMASESSGKSFYPSNMLQLAEQIKMRNDIKPVVYSNKSYLELIDYYPLMILLFLILGAEWFIRKYLGGY